jgi:hypothetical protein
MAYPVGAARLSSIAAMADLGGSITHAPRQNKPPDPSYLAGFASLRGEAYLVAMKAMS